jgi:hypothetical protein
MSAAEALKAARATGIIVGPLLSPAFMRVAVTLPFKAIRRLLRGSLGATRNRRDTTVRIVRLTDRSRQMIENTT